MEYTKPLPAIDIWNKPFWSAAHQGRLEMQHCDACGHVFFPPGPVCPGCLSDRLTWKPLSGKGEVLSWVVFHQLYFKGFADDLPYNVSLIRLQEGPLMYSNVVGIDNDALRSGLQVEVVFEPASDAIHIPKFKAVAP
jgi:uncharacterized OB-fold protein